MLGREDPNKLRETKFWRYFLEGGIPDDVSRRSVQRFKDAFSSLDKTLEESLFFLLGDELSVLDVAWVIYVYRLVLCGYPAWRLHLRLWQWFEKLSRAPEIKKEIALPPAVAAMVRKRQRTAIARGTSLEQLCGLLA